MIRTGVGALHIAGALTSAPGVGAAALVLEGIVNTCEELRISKVRNYLYFLGSLIFDAFLLSSRNEASY
jgi:uncharacterized transporter YbjL